MSKWKFVIYQVPKENKRVLVYGEAGMYVAEYSDSRYGGQFYISDCKTVYNPIAWQYLPEPPKGE